MCGQLCKHTTQASFIANIPQKTATSARYHLWTTLPLYLILGELFFTDVVVSPSLHLTPLPVSTLLIGNSSPLQHQIDMPEKMLAGVLMLAREEQVVCWTFDACQRRWRCKMSNSGKRANLVVFWCYIGKGGSLSYTFEKLSKQSDIWAIFPDFYCEIMCFLEKKNNMRIIHN